MKIFLTFILLLVININTHAELPNESSFKAIRKSCIEYGLELSGNETFQFKDGVFFHRFLNMDDGIQVCYETREFKRAILSLPQSRDGYQEIATITPKSIQTQCFNKSGVKISDNTMPWSGIDQQLSTALDNNHGFLYFANDSICPMGLMYFEVQKN